MKTMHQTSTPEETKKVAADFARTLVGGETLALVGDLGSGKTTFVQGLAEALGSTVRVKSPTFTIMNVYPLSHATITQMVHIDFYRMSGRREEFGLDEYKNPHTIIVEEWPQTLDQENGLTVVTFRLGKTPTERSIEIEKR